MEDLHAAGLVGCINARSCEPEDEHGGVSFSGGVEDLDTKVLWCDGSSVIDHVNIVGTKHLNVPVLAGVRLGAGKIITVGGDWRHNVWHNHCEIPRREGQTESCMVGQSWFLLKLVSVIEYRPFFSFTCGIIGLLPQVTFSLHMFTHCTYLMLPYGAKYVALRQQLRIVQ